MPNALMVESRRHTGLGRAMLAICLFLMACTCLPACGASAPATEVLGEPPPPQQQPPAFEAVTAEYAASGPTGGPFKGLGDPALIKNESSNDISYEVTCDVAWVAWTAPSTGTVEAGAELTVSLTVDQASSPSAAGLYAATVEVRDTGTGLLYGSIAVTLVVESSGWSEFKPSSDSREIFVSSSTGDDANSGLTEGAPKRTIAAGLALMRSGYPEFLYLRRGDTWYGEDLTLFKSGRSATERMVFTSYGASTERPKMVDGACYSKYERRIENLALIGLHFEKTPTGTQGNGIAFLSHGENLLIEDCQFSRFHDNLNIQGKGGLLKNFALRRCVIVDAYASSGAHSQGLFLAGTEGVMIEENIFDHNGWNLEVEGAEDTIFNHNMYLHNSCSDLTVRRNISANASSHGLQQRSGGICQDNLFIGNPIALVFGHLENNFDTQKASGTVEGNVIIDGRDIGAAPRGFGIWLEKVENTVARRNLMVHQTVGTQAVAFRANSIYEGVRLEDNVIYNWGLGVVFYDDARGTNVIKNNTFHRDDGGYLIDHNMAMDASRFTYSGNKYWTAASAGDWFRLSTSLISLSAWETASGEAGASAAKVNFPDPTRTIATYWAAVGGTGGRAGFLAALRGQSRTTWEEKLTAAAVNSYMRAGYGVADAD